MILWEYRVEELSEVQMANQLNFLGSEGWELVAVQFKEKVTFPYLCFFKRQKENK